MPTQTVTFTPANTMTQEEAITHIRGLLPESVTSFLDIQMGMGGWSRTISESGGTYTITNTFTQTAADEYRTLMADVSAGVKSQLATDGWTISFNPETADL